MRLISTIILLWAMLLSCPVIYAQPERMNSIYEIMWNPLKRIPTYSSADTIYIMSLITEGNGSKPHKAIELYSKALQLSKKLNYNDGCARALINMSYDYSLNEELPGHLDSSLACAYAALSYCKSGVDNKLYYAYAYSNIANTLGRQSKAAESFMFYQKALKSILQYNVKDSGIIWHTYLNLSQWYAGQNGLNQGYSGQHNIDNALLFLKKAEGVLDPHADREKLGFTWTVFGSAYMGADEHEKAIVYFKKALANGESTKQPLTVMIASANLALIYAKMGNAHLAKDYLQKTKTTTVANFINAPFSETNFYYASGYAHHYLNEFEEAKRFFLLAIQKSENSQLEDTRMMSAHFALADIYVQHKNYQQAFEHQRKGTELYVRLLKDEDLRSINELTLKYHSTEKDKLIAHHKLQIVNQQYQIQKQYLWIGGIAGSTLIISLVLLILLWRKHHKEEIARLKAVMVGEEQERSRLATELHDGIVSQLSAIRMNFSSIPAQHQDLNEAAEDFQVTLKQLEQSIAELRLTTHNMLPGILQQAGLTEALRVYCQKISNPAYLEIEFIVLGQLPELQQTFQLHVYRIIQELVHNIIKHARASQALVQINNLMPKLLITVDDNGLNNNVEKWNFNKGIGLKNVQTRVRTLGGKMEIETHNGTSVYLEFDLKKFIIKTGKESRE